METTHAYVVVPIQRDSEYYGKWALLLPLCLPHQMNSRNKLPTSSKGSLSIIVSILKSPAETRWTSYHQMVLGISTFDLVGSTGYVFSSAMIAKSSGLYGAAGNDTTCQLQGFMIQLGYTSIFYNLGLSCYFFLVICHSWKERQFQKFHVYVHVITLVLGCGLAFGALSFVGPQYGVCHVSSINFFCHECCF